MDMDNVVVDHVADHLRSLFLMALPSLENNTQETPGAFRDLVLMAKDSFKPLMNGNCVPQPPSGRDHPDGASLPPEAWSCSDRDSIVSHPMPGPSSSRDKEYLDYTHPEDPTEPSE